MALLMWEREKYYRGKDKRFNELERAAKDKDYQHQIMVQYGIRKSENK